MTASFPGADAGEAASAEGPLGHAVGIHTNEFVGGNSATRISRPVYDNLVRWKQEGD